MSELKKILKEMAECRELMQRDLSKVPYENRLGIQTAQAQAKRKLATLSDTYKQTASKNIAKVFISNSTLEQTKEFANFMRNGNENIVFSPLSLYDNIAETIKPKLSSGNVYLTPAYLSLCETCRILGEHFMVFPAIPLKPEGISTVINTGADLVNIVKNTVRAAYGDTMSKAYINEQVFKDAMDMGFSRELAVVVLGGVTPEERGNLYDTIFPGQPSFNVDLENKDPTLSDARKVLYKIANIFKVEKKEKTVETNKQ